MTVLALNYVVALNRYVPGKPIDELAREYGLQAKDIVKLASNENPLGMPLSARMAIGNLMQQSAQDLGRYPDPNGFDLKQAIAQKYAVPIDYITLGNGSNDLLELISLAFLNEHTSCVYSNHAFMVYRLATQARGAEHICVAAQDYGHDLEAMLAAIKANTRVVFIANPNNPTGTFIAGAKIADFVQRVYAKYGNQVVVVLDEAYNEYLDAEHHFDSAELVRQFSNLVVLRTFSKAYGLAALRVGYAISQTEITDFLNRVRQPFNVNIMALVAAQAALVDQEFLQATYQQNKAGKAYLESEFTKLGLSYVPSFGNFILVKIGTQAAKVNQALLAKGIIVRYVAGDGLPEHLRVSIGLPDENQRFIAALQEVLSQAV